LVIVVEELSMVVVDESDGGVVFAKTKVEVPRIKKKRPEKRLGGVQSDTTMNGQRSCSNANTDQFF